MIELVISVIAILISLWLAFRSYRSEKRQSEWQERLLHLEEAEEKKRSTASQSAKLQAVLDRNTMFPTLLVINSGEAKARDISVKINGTPIFELALKDHPPGHFIVRDQMEVRQLGPGGSARYILTRTSGKASLFQIEISWADETNAAQSWRSELSLAVAGD